MALSCNETPHWTTLAAFVSSHCDAIKSLFERVLLVCEQQRLLGHEVQLIQDSAVKQTWRTCIKEEIDAYIPDNQFR